MRNLSGNAESGNMWELKDVVGILIAHLVGMLIIYPFVAFIFCIEIIALGYRWRIVLIVVDNA